MPKITAMPSFIAEHQELQAALAPFAALLQDHHKTIRDDTPVFSINDALITAGDLRRAQTLLQRIQEPKQ